MTPQSQRVSAEVESMRRVLAAGCGGGRLSAPIAQVRRRPSEYATSCRLEEVDLVLEDGAEVPLMFKDLSPSRLSRVAQRVRPAFLYDPRREIEVYAGILAEAGQGTARCHGTLADDPHERYWLFIERVPGVELYHVGDLSLWEATARWLAAWHTRFADGDAMSRLRSSRLIRHDEAFYLQWPARAVDFVASRRPSAPPGEVDVLTRVAHRYHQVAETLLAAEPTFLHGECYASNVMVVAGDGQPRICPIDWEMAAIGPGLIDLAALTSGRWAADQRAAIVRAYIEALPAGSRLPDEAVDRLLDCGRMHVAMQWLGWARDWRPPAAHSQDWLGEVVRLAGRLGIS